jgi:hypothetical protein
MPWCSVCQRKSLEGLRYLTELLAICGKVPRFDEAASTKVLCLPFLRLVDDKAISKPRRLMNILHLRQVKAGNVLVKPLPASNYDSYLH